MPETALRSPGTESSNSCRSCQGPVEVCRAIARDDELRIQVTCYACLDTWILRRPAVPAAS